MENNTMYIKLYESILDSELWEMKTNTIKTFLTILLLAQKYDNGEYKSGHCYKSELDMAEKAKISKNTLTSSLKDLIDAGMITKKTLYNKDGKIYGTEIVIVNWSKYQTFMSDSKSQVSDNQSRSNFGISVGNSVGISVEHNKYSINKEQYSSTTTSVQPTNEVGNTFEEIPSEESKDYFTLKEVYDRLYSLYKEDTLDEAAKSFIKTKFFMIRSKGFTKKSGEIWDLLSFTNWLTKLLSEEGYSLPTPVFDITKAKTFSPVQNVIPPFTKDDVRNCLKNENDEVINELLIKYDDFARNNFKTKNGNAVTLSFMTGYLKDEVKKGLGIKDNGLPDYSKIDVKNFFRQK